MDDSELMNEVLELTLASQRGEDFMGKLYTVSVDGGLPRNAGPDTQYVRVSSFVMPITCWVPARNRDPCRRPGTTAAASCSRTTRRWLCSGT